jgi:hypothetical protein
VGDESTTDAGHRAKNLPDLDFIEPTTGALVRQQERERRGGGASNRDQAGRPRSILISRRGDEITPQAIDWLWPGRIARGKISAVARSTLPDNRRRRNSARFTNSWVMLTHILRRSLGPTRILVIVHSLYASTPPLRPADHAPGTQIHRCRR